MDVARPYAAVSPTLDSEALAVLSRTTGELTGREVARLASRGSERGVALALHRLAEHGLVDVKEAGTALLYTLNRDHLAAEAVERLVGMRAELVRRLKQRIGNWKVKPIHASLFGSTARGDGDTASDIDLFLVRPDKIGEENSRWRKQRDGLSDDIRRWTGNRAAIAELSEKQIRRMRREQPPITAELRADAIPLAGRTISELFGSGTSRRRKAAVRG